LAEQTLGDIHTEYLVKINKEMPPAAFPIHSECDLWYPVTVVKGTVSRRTSRAHKDRRAMSYTGSKGMK